MLPLKEEFELLDFEVLHRDNNTICFARETGGKADILVLTFWDQGSDMFCAGTIERNGEVSKIQYRTVKSVINLLTASRVMEGVMSFHKPKRVRRKPVARKESEVS